MFKLLHVQDYPLLANAEHMNPIEALKDPPCCRALSWIPFLIGIRLACLLQALPDSPLQRRVDRETKRHHHQECHDPLFVLQVQRVGKKLRVLRKAESSFNRVLAFVSLQKFFAGELLSVQRGSFSPANSALRASDGTKLSLKQVAFLAGLYGPSVGVHCKVGGSISMGSPC